MNRPWYMSLLFWLGLVGFVLLVGIWVDSTRFRTYAGFPYGGIVNEHEFIRIEIRRYPGSPPSQSRRPEPSPLNWSPILRIYPVGSGTTVVVSHTFILLLYLLLWASLALWRLRLIGKDRLSPA
jgi:hypothetical protein